MAGGHDGTASAAAAFSLDAAGRVWRPLPPLPAAVAGAGAAVLRGMGSEAVALARSRARSRARAPAGRAGATGRIPGGLSLFRAHDRLRRPPAPCLKAT